MHPIKHFNTITHHRMLVAGYCFRLGLYRQGLTHDLSKYSPVEFWAGAKYYTGTCSPNNGERLENGYSLAWLHHKGRNRHHLEYWIDYSMDEGHEMMGLEMPVKYVAEMFCDRVAACRVYRGKNYTDADAYNYYMNSKKHYMLNPKTAALLESMLITLRDHGEDEAFAYIKKEILGKRN